MDPSTAAAKALATIDTDGDGQIEAPEMAASPGLQAALAGADADKNGSLSKDEISNRLKSYVDAGVSLVFYDCLVLLDNRPLEQAKVSLVPEPMLEAFRKPAYGVTDATGRAAVKIEGNENYGLYYGMYRVQISKTDPSGRELLPAKYNQQTILGQEVGPGVDIEHGVTFHLKRAP